MAKIRKLPSLAIIVGFKGTLDFYVCRGIPCVRTWPRAPTLSRSKAVQAQWQPFTYVSKAWNFISPMIQDAYRQTTTGTNLSGRDLLIKNFITPAYLILE